MYVTLRDVEIEVTDRSSQWKLLFGTITGFFKKLPVTVYEGEVDLNVDQPDDLALLRREVNRG